MSSTTSTTSSKHSTKHGSKQTTFAKQSARKSEQNVSTYDSRHVVGKTYVATETMPVPSYRPLSEQSFRPIEPVYATIAPKAERHADEKDITSPKHPDAPAETPAAAAAEQSPKSTEQDEEKAGKVPVSSTAVKANDSVTSSKPKLKVSNSHDERKAAGAKKSAAAGGGAVVMTKKTATDVNENKRSTTESADSKRTSSGSSQAARSDVTDAVVKESAPVQQSSAGAAGAETAATGGTSPDTVPRQDGAAVTSSNLSDVFADWTSTTPALSEQV